MEELERHWTIW